VQLTFALPATVPVQLVAWVQPIEQSPLQLPLQLVPARQSIDSVTPLAPAAQANEQLPLLQLQPANVAVELHMPLAPLEAQVPGAGAASLGGAASLVVGDVGVVGTPRSLALLSVGFVATSVSASAGCELTSQTVGSTCSPSLSQRYPVTEPLSTWQAFSPHASVALMPLLPMTHGQEPPVA
jgi:hypothetical protein